jgi:hypothetical protein
MSDTKVKDRWYVCTDYKRLGGKVIQTSYGDFLGPYDTVEEALACRFGFEQGTRGEGRYYVDNWAESA